MSRTLTLDSLGEIGVPPEGGREKSCLPFRRLRLHERQEKNIPLVGQGGCRRARCWRRATSRQRWLINCGDCQNTHGLCTGMGSWPGCPLPDGNWCWAERRSVSSSRAIWFWRGTPACGWPCGTCELVAPGRGASIICGAMCSVGGDRAPATCNLCQNVKMGHHCQAG